MSAAAEMNTTRAVKHGAEDTCVRLDALLAEQRRTNDLLLWLGQCIQMQQPQPGPSR